MKAVTLAAEAPAFVRPSGRVPDEDSRGQFGEYHFLNLFHTRSFYVKDMGYSSGPFVGLSQH